MRRRIDTMELWAYGLHMTTTEWTWNEVLADLFGTETPVEVDRRARFAAAISADDMDGAIRVLNESDVSADTDEG